MFSLKNHTQQQNIYVQLTIFDSTLQQLNFIGVLTLKDTNSQIVALHGQNGPWKLIWAKGNT